MKNRIRTANDIQTFRKTDLLFKQPQSYKHVSLATLTLACAINKTPRFAPGITGKGGGDLAHTDLHSPDTLTGHYLPTWWPQMGGFPLLRIRWWSSIWGKGIQNAYFEKKEREKKRLLLPFLSLSPPPPTSNQSPTPSIPAFLTPGTLGSKANDLCEREFHPTLFRLCQVQDNFEFFSSNQIR